MAPAFRRGKRQDVQSVLHHQAGRRGHRLGLSISHDIIVKQHSGTIAVDTEAGKFTEFKIVLPRAGASLNKSGDHA